MVEPMESYAAPRRMFASRGRKLARYLGLTAQPDEGSVSQAGGEPLESTWHWLLTQVFALTMTVAALAVGTMLYRHAVHGTSWSGGFSDGFAFGAAWAVADAAYQIVIRVRAVRRQARLAVEGGGHGQAFTLQ